NWLSTNRRPQTDCTHTASDLRISCRAVTRFRIRAHDASGPCMHASFAVHVSLMVHIAHARQDPSGVLPHGRGERAGARMAQQLPDVDRTAIGRDLLRVQHRWPVGMPLARPLTKGLWELRTNLAGNRIARLIFCFHDEELVVLNGFIKKSQKLPMAEM